MILAAASKFIINSTQNEVVLCGINHDECFKQLLSIGLKPDIDFVLVSKGFSGDYNSGDKNSGDCNTGSYNIGSDNSRFCNIGSGNSGSFNSGDSNAGDYNSGDWNTGKHNTGDFNSGDWNTGNHSVGCFCMEKDPTIKLFDKDSDWTFSDWRNSKAYRILNSCPYSRSEFIYESWMTEKDKNDHPEYKTIGGFLHEHIVTDRDRQKWWDELPKGYKNEIKSIPNFDPEIFKECTGIIVE